jgi:hypothetical protein
VVAGIVGSVKGLLFGKVTKRNDADGLAALRVITAGLKVAVET